MRRQLLRIKQAGCEICEIYIDSIIGFDISYDGDIETYFLSVRTTGIRFIICEGNSDYCHSVLNRIHNSLERSEKIITLQ